MNNSNHIIPRSAGVAGRFHRSLTSAAARVFRWLLLGVALTTTASLQAQTWYYFSGAGANGNWSNPANWSVNGVPPANSANTAVFILSSANNKTSQVDIAGLVLRQLVVQCTNHTFGSSVARTLTLLGQGPSTPTVQLVIPSELDRGRWTFQSNLELALSGHCLMRCEYQTGSQNGGLWTTNLLALAGRVSGTGALDLDAAVNFDGSHFFEVALQGALGNTFTGGTVVGNQTTLLLDKSSGVAVPGPLTVHEGVRWLRSHQVPDNAAITVGGFLSIGAFNETVGTMHLAGELYVGGYYSGGFVSTTTGLLTLAGDVTAASQTKNSIDGNLALGTPADSRIGRQFMVETGAELEIGASISGSPIVRKLGDGALFLRGSNIYTGLTVVQEGEVWIGRSNALGAASAGTLVSDTAALGVDRDLNCGEPLDLADHGSGSQGTVKIESADVLWTGPIHLQGTARFRVTTQDAFGHLDITGPVMGPGTFVSSADNDSDVTFSGSATNTHTGGTVVGGDLYLRRAGSGRAIPGSLQIAGGTVRPELPDQFAPDSAVTIGAVGSLWQSAHQYIGSLAGSGFVVLATSILTVGGDNSDSLFAGRIQSFGSPNSFIKAGSGTVTLTGLNTFTGNTTVQGGRLSVNGTNAVSPVNILPGATLSGAGTVAQITGTGGSTSPGGTGWATLKSGSLAWTTAHTYRPEINGTNSGVDCDLLRVVGTVNLNGAALSPVITAGGKPGAMYLLIENDGTDAVIGTFTGRPQGALVTLNGIQYQISYTGGTGNDVVLTQLSSAPAPTLSGIQKLPNGQTRITGNGGRGFNYEVHATISLAPAAWVNLGPVTADFLTGALQFIDADSALLPARFYRFVLP